MALTRTDAPEITNPELVLRDARTIHDNYVIRDS